MKWILPFVLLICTLSADAQVRAGISFSGKVTDGVTGEPLPGASIVFTDAKIGTVANDKGEFILRNFPPGHHLVEISHLGYTTLVEHIDITKETQKDFILSPTV